MIFFKATASNNCILCYGMKDKMKKIQTPIKRVAIMYDTNCNEDNDKWQEFACPVFFFAGVLIDALCKLSHITVTCNVFSFSFVRRCTCWHRMANSLPAISTEITGVYTVTIGSNEGNVAGTGTTGEAEGAVCGCMPEGTEDAACSWRCCLWLHARRNRRRCWQMKALFVAAWHRE